MLGEAFLEIASDWIKLFPQPRSFHRALAMAVGILCGIGRGTTSRAILALGKKDQDWSADYRLCSRTKWREEDLFTCALRAGLEFCGDDWVVLAFDDTRLKKTGKKIAGAQYYRDPLSPHFHPNLMYGLRILQGTVLLPFHETSALCARSVPISFESVPCAKKPGKKAPPETWEAYKKEQRAQNLSVAFVNNLHRQRLRLDELGRAKQLMAVAVDGSFCNKKCLTGLPERTAVIARTRKDARLCFPAPEGSRKKYQVETFTPEAVMQNELIPYKKAEFVFGSAKRELSYKRLDNVLWQGGTKTRKITLLVIAPIPYRLSPNGGINFRQPAFLICTGPELPTEKLIQAYLDRWQIEVNHKDEKDVLGVGQAQVWSRQAIPRQPALVVAAYAILLVASMKAFGPSRTDAYEKLPKWRKRQRRPSILDLLTMLRKEFADPNTVLSKTIAAPKGFKNLVDTAAA